MSPVIVYSSNSCPNCENLKKALTIKAIEYQEINITERPQEAQMLREKGFRQLPVIEDNGEWMSGFTPQNFTKIVKAHSVTA
uniref:NrdH-redoxin family protein n=1 Tax=Burkholderia phage vB_BgluM-SURPRISE13 TaxID=3159457 RepID=A0AAU7PFL7_9VIRU